MFVDYAAVLYSSAEGKLMAKEFSVVVGLGICGLLHLERGPPPYSFSLQGLPCTPVLFLFLRFPGDTAINYCWIIRQKYNAKSQRFKCESWSGKGRCRQFFQQQTAIVNMLRISCLLSEIASAAWHAISSLTVSISRFSKAILCK